MALARWISTVGGLGWLLTGCTDSEDPTHPSSTQETATTSAVTSPSSATSSGWYAPCPIDEREQRSIDVGEVTLNVACRGAGPTVVFLHGFPEFHYSWNAVMDELVEDYRLIAPDQRGYNTSDKPNDVDAYRLPLLVADILALLPLVSEDPVLLVAHDWGGPVAWTVAHHPDGHVRGLLAANGPHPARFAELIATDPAQQKASSYMAWLRNPMAELFLTPKFLISEFSDLLSEEDRTIYLEALGQPGAITGGLNWYRANTLKPSSIDDKMEGLSPTIPVPVTVMWGLDDTAVLASNAEGLEVYAPDLVVETFPGVDHWIEHRIPDAIARGIRELDQRATE